MHKVVVLGPDEKYEGRVIDVTSNSQTFGRELSPFLLGPVEMYADYTSNTMENAWQFCKVYRRFTKDDEPADAYWEWAKRGWSDDAPHKYPMGRLSIPLYSLWDGRKLDYIQARKDIYVPLYAKAARNTNAYRLLVNRIEKFDVILFDYDSYNIETRGMTMEQALNDKTRRFGHGMVLKMMLDGMV